MIQKRFLILFCLFLTLYSNGQKLTIIQNGKSNYSILTTQYLDSSTYNAVKLFNNYIHEISGVFLPVNLSNLNHKRLVIFKIIENSALTSDEGYTIKTEESNLVFESKTGKGLQNAVYTFLENYLGCRCYAEDAIIIPKSRNITIQQFSITENPSFYFRVPHYFEAYNTNYRNWNKLTNAPRDKTKKDWPISNEWGMWVHTLHRLVPPEKYFDEHPEYYSLRNGQRIKDQLCLTNPEVLDITIKSLKEEIAKNPTAKYWSVSQLDNYNFCECDKCKEIDSIEGSNAGSIIRFVNKVAEQFPDKVISTLAYQYSRKATKVTKPAKNVNIMLCTIECDRSKPIEMDKSEGGFHNDLKGWASISDNILIWDYVINFSHLVGPFPNFQVLSPNINLFKKYNVGMIFEQGYRGNSGELNELRCYIISKLLWNSKLDEDSLMNDFLNGYYGPAGKFIREYIELETSELNKSGRSLTLYEPPAVHSKGYLSPENLEKYFSIFENAKNAVKGDKIYEHRVEMALQSVRYAWLEVCKSIPNTPGWIFQKSAENKLVLKPQALEILNDFYSTASKFGPSILHETKNPPDEYRRKMMDYFKNGIVEHFAVGKTILLEKNYAPQYSADGPNSLIDGVHGTEDYQVLWQGWQGDDVIATIDLKENKTISNIEVTCLDDNQSWIFAPNEIIVELSEDGKTYYQNTTFQNLNAGAKIDKQIVKFDIPINTTNKASGRFLKIIIKNIGKVPVWRGVDGYAWVFIDEIVVK
ncbi:MAG: DUF4838 domain-containing protein [Tenuifilaceae bacterium]